MKCFSCKHLGVSGTTNVYVQQVQKEPIGEEIWEARIGIAILGYTNNTRKVNNPFDSAFHDNLVRGFGTTEQKAKEALVRDAQNISDGLWA